MGYGKLVQAALDVIDRLKLGGLIGGSPTSGQVVTWGASGAEWASSAAAGVSLASARVIVVDKTTTADADETTIAAGITAAGALSPTPSTTAPALVWIRDSAVYTEDLTTAVGIHVIGFGAIINGAHTLARESSIQALQFGDKGSGSAPMFTGDGGVSGQRRIIAQTIDAPDAASRPVIGVASNSEFGEILVECKDYKASLAPTISVGSSVSFGNLSLALVCDRVHHEAGITSYVHIDCDSTVATTRCHFGARSTRDVGNLDSTGGLFQIAGGIHTIDIGTVPFKSGGTNLLATMTGGTLSGRIGRIENWDSPNAISGTGSFEVKIENEHLLGFSHPLLAQHDASLSHYWPMDDASSTQADDQGSLDFTLNSAFHSLPGPNADGRFGSAGQLAIGVDSANTSYAITSAVAAASGSFTIYGHVLMLDTANDEVPIGMSNVAAAWGTAEWNLVLDGTAGNPEDLTSESTGAADVARADICAERGRWIPFWFSRNASTGAYVFAVDGKVTDSGASGWDTTDLSGVPLQIGRFATSGFNSASPAERMSCVRFHNAYIDDADTIAQHARMFRAAA